MSSRSRAPRVAAPTARVSTSPATATAQPTSTKSKSKVTKKSVAAAVEPTTNTSRAKKSKKIIKDEDEEESKEDVEETESEGEYEVDESADEEEVVEEEKEEAPKKGRSKKVVAPVSPVATAITPVSTKPINPVHAKLGVILDEAQHSYHTHAHLLTQAQTLLQADPVVFLTSFSSYANYVCSKSKKEAPTQRVIEWIGLFVARTFHNNANSVSNQFAERFLEQLLEWSEAKDKTVRWRSVQLFSELMKNMDEECDLPEWLFDGAVAALLVRAEDKIESVRVAAAAALHRFQSGEERDPVTTMYVRMMSYDNSPLVRKAALEHVAAASSPKAIAALLTRVQDAIPAVRVAAFKSIQSKLHMKQLSLESRARLVRLGFRDRDGEVVKAAKALTDTWLQTKDKDVLRLMRSFAVDTFPDECTLLLAHLVRSGAYSWETTQQPPYASNTLTPERALYWRVLAETLSTMATPEAIAALDAALPDTVELCHLLETHSHDAFITSQLLTLTGLSDMGDEAGRRELANELESLLKDSKTSQSLVAGIMKVYRLVHQDENDFIRVILELLADIHNPLDIDEPELLARREELETTYTNMQKQIEDLKVQKQACINAENYQGAELIKSQLSTLSNQLVVVEKELNSTGFQDDGTWARLLSIVCDLLENTQRFKLNHPGLAGLRESIIEPGIQHEHLLIQSLGLKALSLYALLDRVTAKASLPMFLYAANYAETLAQQATAMRAVTDILMLFEDLLDENDPAVVPPVNEAGVVAAASATKIEEVQALFNRHMQTAFEQGMDAEMTEVCVMAIECLAKLLLFGRLPCSPPMLSALLFIFFHPQTDTRITQCLAVFLPGFLLARTEHVQTFFHSVLPTLRILATAVAAADADCETPEENVVWRGFSLSAAGRAMLSFVTPLPKSMIDGRPIQQAFAMEITAQLTAAPASSHTHTLVSLLAVLDFGVVPPAASTPMESAAPFFPSLHHALTSVQSLVKDKVSLKELTKFMDKFVKSYPTSADELTTDQLDSIENWLNTRVAAIQSDQDAERQAAGDADEEAIAAPVASAKKSAPAPVKKLPAKGKKALRPKTPAKSRPKKSVIADSDTEEDANDPVEQDGDESIDEEEFKISKPKAAPKKKSTASTSPVPTANVLKSVANTLPTARPSRTAKSSAATKMKADQKKLAEMDKVIDAESEEEVDQENIPI